jgi:AraC family transcriptional regulator, alkane utilization regulator
MDALSEVLKALRLTTGIFLDAEFTAPWCVDSSPGPEDVRILLPRAEQVSIFHVLTEGRCLVRLSEGGDTLELRRGDLIMFPRCEAHLMGSDVQLAPLPMGALLAPASEGRLPRIAHGGAGARARLVCGYVVCDKRLCRPLLGALPAMVRVPLGDGGEGSWLIESLRRGADESRSRTPGGEAVLSRLAELVFVEAIRRHVASLPEDKQNWLAGVRDPIVGRALALLHASPGRPWTVDELARESASSRSALGKRFAGMVGEPPMQYLTGLRLALAAESLASGQEKVARIAERVGYESEAAFNNAFKREFGVPPAAWRRLARG